MGRAAYLSIFYITIFRIGTSSRRDHSWTRKSLVFILLLRGLSAWVRLDMLTGAKTTQKDVIFDGLFWSMVTSDLIVAKMADRQIHTWVVLMATTVWYRTCSSLSCALSACTTLQSSETS